MSGAYGDFERDDDSRYEEASRGLTGDDLWDMLVNEANDRGIRDDEAIKSWNSRELGPE